MADHTRFHGVENVNDSLLSDQLEANLTAWTSWATLGCGGFYNVGVHESGCYGGDLSLLRRVSDPNYTDGTVYEAFRKDWVWETGVGCPTHEPIRVSGVYVDGAFVPVGSGVRVNYPAGRVVFDSPVPASSAVTCAYSYRLYQFYTADSPAWQQIQAGSFRADDPQFVQVGSGAWDVLSQNRVQLPAVFVEALPQASRKGKSIGSINATVSQAVLFHVLAEERWHAKWMYDAVSNQYQKRLQGFDKNRLFASDAYPLDADGAVRDGARMYPDLVRPTGDGGYFWEQIRFKETTGVGGGRPGGLHLWTVRATIEVDLE